MYRARILPQTCSDTTNRCTVTPGATTAITIESNVICDPRADETNDEWNSNVQSSQGSSSDTFCDVLSSPTAPQFSPVVTASDTAESSGTEEFFNFFALNCPCQPLSL